ncbi:MAG: DUF7379 domain-containing protein [Candidatus Thorarchaeota archaeon]
MEGGISTYAENFKNTLLTNHSAGTQIDIVAYSLGGIITREMLRLYRYTLESAGIEIARVITIGTPHSGTDMATFDLPSLAVTTLISLFGPNWGSAVFYSLNPQSSFMTTLNQDPMSYSNGIEMYTLSGVDLVAGSLLEALGVHDGVNDVIVTRSSASLSYAVENQWFLSHHNALLAQSSYPSVDSWLAGGIDTDQDGLLDVEERHIYLTNPTLPDTDFDGLSDWYEVTPNPYVTYARESDSDGDTLSDGDEILVHGTNPLTAYTDGDILTDAQEIDWEYDLNDTDDPIDADHLTYSAWQTGSTTGYVRANHYTAMSYVIVDVRYMTSSGFWKPYSQVGMDNTPYYNGDYYVSWSIQQGYVQMQVKVKAYDGSGHYLGCDTKIVIIPGGGGPPIE